MSIVKSFNKSVNTLGKPSIRLLLYKDNAVKQTEQYVNLVESSCYLPWANDARVTTKLIIFRFPKQLKSTVDTKSLSSSMRPVQAVLVPRAPLPLPHSILTKKIMVLSKKIEVALVRLIEKENDSSNDNKFHV